MPRSYATLIQGVSPEGDKCLCHIKYEPEDIASEEQIFLQPIEDMTIDVLSQQNCKFGSGDLTDKTWSIIELYRNALDAAKELAAKHHMKGTIISLIVPQKPFEFSDQNMSDQEIMGSGKLYFYTVGIPDPKFLSY